MIWKKKICLLLHTNILELQFTIICFPGRSMKQFKCQMCRGLRDSYSLSTVTFRDVLSHSATHACCRTPWRVVALRDACCRTPWRVVALRDASSHSRASHWVTLRSAPWRIVALRDEIVALRDASSHSALLTTWHFAALLDAFWCFVTLQSTSWRFTALHEALSGFITCCTSHHICRTMYNSWLTCTTFVVDRPSETARNLLSPEDQMHRNAMGLLGSRDPKVPGVSVLSVWWESDSDMRRLY